MDIAYDDQPDTGMTRLPLLGVLAQTAFFCTIIAVILWQFVPSVGQYGFWSCFVHSQAIGLPTAAMGYSAATVMARFNVHNPLLRALAYGAVTVIGLIAGMLIAGRILGIPSSAGAYLFQDNSLLVTTVTAVLAGIAINWHFRSQHKVLSLELDASEQARKAEQARHALLRAQLEPHMLFNTLANLRALIATDSDKALEMLDRLDGFLRETLASSQSPHHALEREFRILEDYLELIKVRFGDRLTFTLSLPDDCRTLEVPSLLLQPLVENAVRHGIEPSLDGGHVEVSVTRTDSEIKLCISDTGVGMSALPPPTPAKTAPGPSTTQGGFGLSSLRDRLRQHYGSAARLALQPGDAGTTITVSLPMVLKSTAP